MKKSNIISFAKGALLAATMWACGDGTVTGIGSSAEYCLDGNNRVACEESSSSKQESSSSTPVSSSSSKPASSSSSAPVSSSSSAPVSSSSSEQANSSSSAPASSSSQAQSSSSSSTPASVKYLEGVTITCENFRYGEEKGFDLYYDELTNNADGYLTQKDGKSITIFPLSTGDTLLSEATYNMCKPITNGGLNIPSQNNLGVQCDGAFFTAPAQKEEDEIGCWAF